MMGEVAMSNNRDNYWDDEDDEDDVQDQFIGNDTDLVKKLRKQLKVEQKRAKELESTLGELSKAQRERVLKDVLTSKGINMKVAKFIPTDIDASEEAIGSWLEQNGDVFGFTPEPKAPIAEYDKASLRQMDVVTQSAVSPERADEMVMKIDNAESADELLAFLRSQQ
jgi:hypothetical protein